MAGPRWACNLDVLASRKKKVQGSDTVDNGIAKKSPSAIELMVKTLRKTEEKRDADDEWNPEIGRGKWAIDNSKDRILAGYTVFCMRRGRIPDGGVAAYRSQRI